MIVPLNLETIRSLVSPTGDAALVNALFVKQYHKCLVGLHQLHQKLLAEARALVERTGFDQAYEALSRLPPASQKAILTHPSVRVWLNVAWNLVHRQSHVRFPEMHVQMHLEEFGRITLATALNAGIGDFEFSTWTDAKGRVILPGIGTYVEDPKLLAYERLRMKVHNGRIIAVTINGAREVQLEMMQHQVPTIANRIELNAVDSDLQIPGRGSFDYEQLGLEAVIGWQAILEQSWAWITECSPALAGEMLMSLRAIVPVRSNAVDVHVSASFREAPGLVALSWTPDASVMVEALVHEYHHQKLNALLNVDPLIVGPTADAIYYSPWRDDARPLLGILHGAYAFQAVLQFCKTLFEADIPLLQEVRVRQRMFLVKGQVQTALNSLRDVAQLSPLGEAFVDAMTEKVNTLDVALPDTERAVQHRLDTLQAEHRARWESENARRTNGAVPNSKEVQSLEASQSQNEERAVSWLRLNAGFDPTSVKGSRYQPDSILNAIIFAYHERILEELKKILAEAKPDESWLLCLLAGHIAYVESQYELAATRYESCITTDPSNMNFWQCFAYALRHLARWREADMILTNLGRVTRTHYGVAVKSGDNRNAVEERLANLKRILEADPYASMES